MFQTVPLSIIRSFSLYTGVFHCTHNNSICHTGLLTACEQDQDGTGSILILLASCQQTCMTHHCCVYSEELLMMDRGTVRNMHSFVPKINLRN